MNEQSMGNTDRDLVDPNLSGSSIDFSIGRLLLIMYM